jgi:hypothetical protein
MVDHFIRAYYPYILAGIQLLIFLGGLALTGKFVTRKDCKDCRKSCGEKNWELAEGVDELEKRVTRNEDKLADLPTGDEISSLTLALESLSGDVRVLAERIEGVKEAQKSTRELATRLDNFLRNQKA